MKCQGNIKQQPDLWRLYHDRALNDLRFVPGHAPVSALAADSKDGECRARPWYGC
ncbi:hypothetical protein BDW74DRAFT_148986 [Aspergillus multicolor]|uniref:uncharacterized protein n=1 Tax=Aspergillus multicolor TaxID=41759 RepID=UPI003CCD15E1